MKKQIIIDTFGSDLGIYPTVKGTIEAKKLHPDYDFVLVGNKEEILDIFKKEVVNDADFKILDSRKYFLNTIKPTLIFNEYRDSTLGTSLTELKNNENTIGLITPGSTGGVLVGSIFLLGLLPNLKFPCLSSVLFTKDKKYFCLVDCGAQVDSKPSDLLNYAKLGNAFMKSYIKVDNPRIGLLSIGREDTKGNLVTKEAFNLLKETNLNFIGNLEPINIFNGEADVVVCDGFSGNVFLKNTETVAMICKNIAMKNVDGEEAKGIETNINGLFSYSDQAGAILLGASKPIIKVHGKCNESTINGAVKQLINLDKGNFIDNIKKDLN
ncbi:MAG: hypothetical protein WCR97_04925 [Bacilli bacterium]